MLSVWIDGFHVILDTEWKPQFCAAGIAYLGGSFEDSLPPYPHTAPEGRRVMLRGFTADPALIALYERFWADANSDHFSVSPVPIPTLDSPPTE